MDNTNKPNPQQFNDFGMEDDNDKNAQAPQEAPKVNNYQNQNSQIAPNVSNQANVNPSAPTPPLVQPVAAPVAPAPAPVQAQSQPQIQQQPQQAPQPQQPQRQSAPRAQISGKMITGLVGGFGALAMIFLVLSFVFVAQTQNEANPIARVLGIGNDAAFVNGLIAFIHIIFLLTALTAFVFAMIGFFKSAMAKKDDKVAKKQGMRTAVIAGTILFVVIILWMFAYIYLDSKRIQTGASYKDPIITEPTETVSLTAPVTIRFDATNVPKLSGYQIISYKWDFGDGSTGTNQIITHEYQTKGTGRYDVILTITHRQKDGTEEKEATYTKVITIADEALRASFTADPQEGEAPLEVSFDASDSADPDGEISAYEWDLNGDGKFDDEKDVKFKHEFDKIGEYKVSLRVTSINGDYAVTDKQIIVKEATVPEAIINVQNEPTEGYQKGVAYIFSAEDSTSPNGKITDYAWDFGDGTKEEKTKTVSHTFVEEGLFNLVLKVTDETEKEGEVRLPIEVGATKGAPRANIKTTPAISGEATTLKGKVPFNVIFDASGSTDSDNNMIDYKWDFNGDGTMDSFGKNVSHTYREQGIYTVALEVYDADDNVGKASLVVEVSAQGISADLRVDKIEGTLPITVKFDATGSSFTNGDIVSYIWDFGDGTKSKIGTSTITHKYNAIGSFKAKVTVVGSDNSKATAEKTITVREIPLEACFTSVFEQGKAPLETVFDPSCTTGTAQNYFWDFGDGSTATEVKPTHTFIFAGDFKVVLEVSDSEGTISTSEMTVKVSE